MAGVMRAVAGLALGLALAGCLSASRTRYDYFLAPGHQGAPGAQRWLLVPTSALVAVPDHLQAPAERLEEELRARLEDAGRGSIPVPLRDVLKSQTVTSAKQGGAADEELESRLARELAASHPVDVVVFPDFVVHEVRVEQGGYAAWDGVKRRQRLVRGEGAPEVYAFGKNQALSLRLRVFGPDGVKRFESRGGLDLLYEARIEGMRYRLEMRSDLLEEPEIVKTGVDLALYPYLPATSRAGEAGDR